MIATRARGPLQKSRRTGRTSRRNAAPWKSEKCPAPLITCIWCKSVGNAVQRAWAAEVWPGRSDIVLSAFDRQQRRAPDRTQINQLAVVSQRSPGHRASVENAVDVFDKVLCVEVHDRAVEVQEGESPWIGAVVVANLLPEFAALVEVSPQVGQQRSQLELRGVDQPAGASIIIRHKRVCRSGEPGERTFAQQADHARGPASGSTGVAISVSDSGVAGSSAAARRRAPVSKTALFDATGVRRGRSGQQA